MMGHDLVVEVEGIKGTCPVFRHGDRMVFLEGYRLDLKRTDALCSHAMGALLPWLASLSKGVEPQQLGLAREGDTDAHVFATEPMAKRCTSAEIDREERKGPKPSDHAPVIATFD